MASVEITSSAKEPEKALLPATGDHKFAVYEVVLRFVLFASALVAVVVMVTGNQTENIQIPFPPFQIITRSAKFTQSAALKYFVVALSVAGFYALITTLVSLYSLLNRGCYAKILSHFVILDVLLLGIVAAAVGAGGADSYIGFKGNSYSGWLEICNRFDNFCRHMASALAVALFGAVVLVLLILLSFRSLAKKIPK